MCARILTGLVLTALFVLLPVPSTKAGSLQNGQALRAEVAYAQAQEKAHPSKRQAELVDEAFTALGRYEGAYRIKNIPIAAAAPTVTAEVEPNDTFAQATELNLTADYAVGTGSLSPGGDVDYWTFSAPAGSRIWIETDSGGTQNSGATSRDTVIDLLEADGTTVIETDDDDGTGNGGDGTVESGLSSVIAGRTLTTSGVHYIRVRTFSGSSIVDPYRLSLALTHATADSEVEGNDTAAAATPIVSLISLHSGAIDVAADVDYYSFAALAGDVVFFAADGDPARLGTGTDLVLELRSSADALLLSVDSSIAGSLSDPTAEGANYVISTSGTYYVKVRHFSATGTGSYDLMVAVATGIFRNGFE